MDAKTWLKERVFRHQDFENLSKLLALKKEQNLSISVGLPTFNVERTLPNILRVIKKSLTEEYPLVDEIAIIDGYSQDKTVDLAKEIGVGVYRENEILPNASPAKGKGEALWKSLYVLKGDIIVWVDSDIENFHPRFVYGLLGPLLANKKVSYVKGFYERPIKFEGRLMSTGGGRVTEILARPLLNLFYPELSVFIQPCSGEYAGRREILEKVPFYTNYGVEIGLLIEILKKFGLETMAQADLARRVHPNQSTEALGKMSFAILEAMFKLLEEEKRVKFASELSSVFRKVRRKNGNYFLDESEIEVVRRPPITEMGEYRQMMTRRKYEGAPAS